MTATGLTHPDDALRDWELWQGCLNEARQDITLLESSASRPVFGNLLSLPVGGGMLYVQPLYLRTVQGENTFPFLHKVLVNFGDKAAYANTLQEGIQALVDQANGGTPSTNNPPTGTNPPSGTQPPNDAVAAAAAKVQAAIDEVRAAQQSGDFERWGRALKALDDAMKAFEDAQKAASAGSGTNPAPGASTPPASSPPASPPPSAPAG